MVLACKGIKVVSVNPWREEEEEYDEKHDFWNDTPEFK